MLLQTIVAGIDLNRSGSLDPADMRMLITPVKYELVIKLVESLKSQAPPLTVRRASKALSGVLAQHITSLQCDVMEVLTAVLGLYQGPVTYTGGDLQALCKDLMEQRSEHVSWSAHDPNKRQHPTLECC